MYIGIAKNNKDVLESLRLATKIFHKGKSISDSAIIKSALLSMHGEINPQDVVIIEHEGKIIGTCFLVDRLFFIKNKLIKGTFLSSICIQHKWRGNGLSKKLMNFSNLLCKSRGSKFSIVIARKKVDYFYQRFNYWGISQYNKISCNSSEIRKISKINNHHKIISIDSGENLFLLNEVYEFTYRNLLGSPKRSAEYWNYLKRRIQIQSLKISIFKKEGDIVGYVIGANEEIYEIAAFTNQQYLKMIQDWVHKNKLEQLIINASSSHKIVDSLIDIDFSIVARNCPYGGHMIRLLDSSMGGKEVGRDYVASEIDCKKIALLDYSQDDVCEALGARLLPSKGGKHLVGQSFNFQYLDLI